MGSTLLFLGEIFNTASLHAIRQQAMAYTMADMECQFLGHNK